MKIYKSNFIKYTLSFSLVIVFGLYFINNISNHSNIDNAKFNSINSNNKSLEWFIEDLFIKTPEIIAKSQTLSYNIDKQFMQLNNNVETIYTKKS